MWFVHSFGVHREKQKCMAIRDYNTLHTETEIYRNTQLKHVSVVQAASILSIAQAINLLIR